MLLLNGLHISYAFRKNGIKPIKDKFITVCMLFIGLTGLHAQTVKDIEGNVYKTITIGNQVWMAENLKTTKLNDGTGIPIVTENSSWEAINTPAYCYYDNNSSNNSVYGALYNWYAVKTNKLCPKGWHVPYDKEWTNLKPLLGGYRGSDATFLYLKDYSYWWTASESSNKSAYYRQVFWDGSDAKRDQTVKNDGFSLRCIMN
jgi:hypothetical protein